MKDKKMKHWENVKQESPAHGHKQTGAMKKQYSQSLTDSLFPEDQLPLDLEAEHGEKLVSSDALWWPENALSQYPFDSNAELIDYSSIQEIPLDSEQYRHYAMNQYTGVMSDAAVNSAAVAAGEVGVAATPAGGSFPWAIAGSALAGLGVIGAAAGGGGGGGDKTDTSESEQADIAATETKDATTTDSANAENATSNQAEVTTGGTSNTSSSPAEAAQSTNEDAVGHVAESEVNTVDDAGKVDVSRATISSDGQASDDNGATEADDSQSAALPTTTDSTEVVSGQENVQTGSTETKGAATTDSANAENATDSQTAATESNTSSSPAETAPLINDNVTEHAVVEPEVAAVEDVPSSVAVDTGSGITETDAGKVYVPSTTISSDEQISNEDDATKVDDSQSAVSSGTTSGIEVVTGEENVQTDSTETKGTTTTGSSDVENVAENPTSTTVSGSANTSTSQVDIPSTTTEENNTASNSVSDSSTDTVVEAPTNTSEESNTAADASADTVIETPTSTSSNGATQPEALTEITTPTVSTEAQFIADNIPAGANYTVVSSMSEAATAVSSNSALNYVLISDGDHFALFEKGNTSGDVSTTWGGEKWGADFTEYVPLSAFLGDSTSNDVSDAFQSAVNLASKLGLGVEFPNEGNYVLTNKVMIPGGVAYVHGNDSVISVESVDGGGNSEPYAIRFGAGTNLSNFEFSDLTIDMNGMENVFAIWGKDVADINIHDINIVDASSTAIYFRPIAVGLSNITIADSNIQLNWEANTANNHYYGINIANTLESSEYTGTYALWNEYRETGKIPENLFNVSGINITGNHINGGYYGISLSGVTNSEVSNNYIENNMRNISLQNNTSGNTIEGNYLTEQASSAVHIAYNSDNNTVKNNTIVSDNAANQALIQAYQDSDNNSFIGNNIELLNKTQAGWAMYSGSDSDGTVIANNVISGRFFKTAIGVEAIWDHNAVTTQAAAYMRSAIAGSTVGEEGTITYNGGVGSVSDISITGNIIDQDYKDASVIYAGAYTSNGYDGNQNIVGDLNNFNVTNNIAIGQNKVDYTDFLRIVENEGNVDLTNSDNRLHEGTATTVYGNTSGNAFVVDSVNDVIVDTTDGDADYVYSTVSYTLPEHVENLILIGSSALNGTGNSSNNILTGNGYDNVLSGGAGDDTLIGGWGSNTLTGGAGHDLFVFNGSLKAGNVSTITDFSIAEDKIGLSSVIFGTLNSDNAWFAASTGEITSQTRVFQDGNKLFYDADGSGAYFSPIEFMQLNTSEHLSQASFQVV